MKKLCLMLLVLGGMVAAHLGCEADGRLPEDGPQAQLDIDD
jgi:hypothetical protein